MLDKYTNINGMPINAYTIVTILPMAVFGVMLPYPENSNAQLSYHYASCATVLRNAAQAADGFSVVWGDGEDSIITRT